MPTLTQLSYIVALQRTGHFGRAAAECGVSQPTLSGQIQKAEHELGVALFDRQSKPIAPTTPGRAIISRALEVLAAHERLLAATGELDTPTGPFTLAVIPTLAPYVLPYFLQTFCQRCPQVELRVVERPTDIVVEQIGAQRVDGAILATPLGEPTLQRRVLFYDPFYVYAHPDSPLLTGSEVQLEDIDRGDLWLLEDGHCVRNQVVHLCGPHVRTILSAVRFDGGSFETLRALIDAAGGFTLVPETYARTLPKSVRTQQIRAFAGHTPTREVSLIAHRAQWKTSILTAIEAAVRDCAPRSLPRDPGEGEILPVRTD
ncbi:MAG: LysR family transcriptional regulator [Myxococcales bacterium]|nr:LysR family transcriptional regulator [Myxococcales bacterium]